MTTTIKQDTPGRRVRRARQWAGFDSQGELAEALRVTRQSVSLWESDKQPLDRRTALALQTLTGVSAEWLMMEADQPATQTSSDVCATWLDIQPPYLAHTVVGRSMIEHLDMDAA